MVQIDRHKDVRPLVSIKAIPHSEQNYETCGDYATDEFGTLHITVSDFGNDDYAFLVAIHELVEAWLCRKRGISDELITAYDVSRETSRQPGDLSEPGDDRECPYRFEHSIATAVERLMCAELGINWFDYEAACQRVCAP